MIRSSENKLLDLMAPGLRLEMPPYQRSYSWEVNETRDLLNDLLEATDTGTSHFLGAIVLVEDGTRAKQIVDGQQRLTTLTILLCVLRDLEANKVRIEEISRLIADPPGPDPDAPVAWRLTLNHIDGPYFREAIQRPGATRLLDTEPGESESQKRMSANAAALSDDLKTLPVETRRALFDTIRDRLVFVRVTVADWDGGYRVFRVLNTRGKAPNSHDIIKTDLLERSNLTPEEADNFSRRWAEHEASLGGSGFDDLLQQVRVLHDRNAKGDAPSAFRKSVLSRIPARDFLSSHLPRYVSAYRVVATGKPDFGDYSDAVARPLNHLRALDHHLWRAPALKFLVEHKDDPEQAVAFFEGLERLGYAMMLVVTNRDHRLKRYGKVADAVGNPTALFAKNGPFALNKDERRKIQERLRSRFATFGQRRCLSLRLNAAIEGGMPLVPEDDATVEHVLPRTVPPHSHWNNTWPNANTQRELCDTLGNFILLPQQLNQQADRLNFHQKKAIYFNGGSPHFALTEDLRDRHSWTPEIVRERTDRLADILSEAWSLT